jgi:hypothetical protein
MAKLPIVEGMVEQRWSAECCDWLTSNSEAMPSVNPQEGHFQFSSDEAAALYKTRWQDAA